jgi:hypothetical protein
MAAVVTIALVCTDRRAPDHDPEVVYRYDGPVPAPREWTFYVRRSELDLNCGRCGRSPRPGNERLCAWIEAAAGQPDRTLDISFADL